MVQSRYTVTRVHGTLVIIIWTRETRQFGERQSPKPEKKLNELYAQRRTLIRHGVEILRRSFFHFQGVRAFKSCKNYPVRVRVMVRDMVSVRVRVRASVRVRVVLRRGLLRGELKCAIRKFQ